MEKKIRRIGALFLLGLLGLIGFPLCARAEESAVFHVQASEKQADGTIRVSVYLTDTANLGGVEAELVFDPDKVTYVDSGLGESFKEGYGETNCNAGSNTIKCVTVYPESKTAHGELMYATFQLNGIESYQPEFRVVNMLDSSEEINPIPYTITYQQADGSWTDVQDTSGTVAEESVIAQAKESYGAPEDQGQHSLQASSGDVLLGDGTSGSVASESGASRNAESRNGTLENGSFSNKSSVESKSEDNNFESSDSEDNGTDKNFVGDNEREENSGNEPNRENEGTGEDKNSVQFNVIIIGIAVMMIMMIIILAVVLITICSKKSWRKRNER